MREEIKECKCSWEACAGPWEQFGFLKNYEFLHDPGGDICIYIYIYIYMYIYLLIVPSFFAVFHTS